MQQAGSTCRKSARKSAGFTLFEVLVALVVLAVGMLGTASLQLTSKRSSMEAKSRTMATMVAQGFVERMRMNPRQLATYTNAGAGRVLTGATFAAVDCSVACTDIEMANLDLFELEQALIGAAEDISGTSVGGISEPRACINGPDGGSGTYTVAIAWRGLTRLSDPGTHTCGQGTGAYDTADGAQADVYRRVLLVDTFISVPP